MSLQAFGPRGPTANIACNATASVPVRVKGDGQSCYTYQLVNSGNAKCYFNYSPDPVVGVTIPTPGNPQYAVPVLPNEIVVYNLTPNAYFTAICESGDVTTLLVTPGEGM